MRHKRLHVVNAAIVVAAMTVAAMFAADVKNSQTHPQSKPMV